ncbi:unnamed protein product, partial [Symbiodinium necroappetens]
MEMASVSGEMSGASASSSALFPLPEWPEDGTGTFQEPRAQKGGAYRDDEVVYDRGGFSARVAVLPPRSLTVLQNKSALTAQSFDRQIGDRRSFNATELSVDGPSRELPPGDHVGVEVATSAHEGPTYLGLIIDDFFTLSEAPTKSKALLDKALVAYDRLNIPGSSEKDQLNELTFIVAGAQIDSSEQAIRDSMISVASPAAKRCALCLASLAAAWLRVTSRALLERITGSWVHCMMYRRPTSVVFAKIYRLIHSPDMQHASNEAVFSLSRGVADELVLASVLSFVMATNIGAQIVPTLFASDASMAKGALVSTPLSEEEAALLWITSDRKGGYSRLDPAARALLRSVGDPMLEETRLAGLPPLPAKNPPLKFDFLEIGLGTGVGQVTACCLSQGIVCCPPLDPFVSRQYDLRSIDVIHWVVSMLQEGRILSVFVVVSETHQDLGLKRALAILLCARSYDRAAAVLGPDHLEQNQSEIWAQACSRKGTEEITCKLGYEGDCRGILESSGPTSLFNGWMRRFARAHHVEVAGLESPVLNDFLSSRAWGLVKVWSWKYPEHINPADREDRRVLHLFDSSVSLAAATKGRTSSHKLRRVLCQVNALALAKGVFCAEGFAPTRLNVADDPTRSHEIRSPAGASLVRAVPPEVLGQLARIRVRRFAANWLRLAVLLTFCVPCGSISAPRLPHSESTCDPTVDSLPPFSSSGAGTFIAGPVFFSSSTSCGADFDFNWTSVDLSPPSLEESVDWTFVSLACLASYLLAFCHFPGRFVFGVGLLISLCRHGCSAAPAGTGYAQRAAARAATNLFERRSVLPRTDTHRQRRLADFSRWLEDSSQYSLEEIVGASGIGPEVVNTLLVEFGQPILRRQLTAAWDMAFNWLEVEAGLFSLMWGGLCRPGEVIFSLRRHLVLPEDVLGRWLSPRVMEIYLQEVEAATFLSDQRPEVRAKVLQCEGSGFVLVLLVWPRIYIVLRASAFEGAARFSSFKAFKSAVGPLENSSTVCHAFASLAEAEVFCEAAGFDLPAAIAIPVLKRQEGAEADALATVGHSRQVKVPFGMADEQGTEQPVDLEDFGLDSVFPFILHHPLSDDPLGAAREWLAEAPHDRLAFYSAQEELPLAQVKPKGKRSPQAKKRVTTADLAAQMTHLTALLPQLTEQLTTMQSRQDALEKQVQGQPAQVDVPKLPHQQHFVPLKGPGITLGKQASLLGPPPRTRPLLEATPAVAAGVGPLPLAASPVIDGPQEPFQSALLQQSQALSALVGHLVAQQEGGLSDLTASSSSSIGAKGAAKREKLQAALAARSGDFLSVLQAAARRMQPSQPIPASLSECSSQVSMCQYLERFGTFSGQREAGYTMWCLAHVMDCLAQEDIAGAREFLALTFVAMDQASIDGGRWDFAWLLTLLEEPPMQMFRGMGQVANPRTRAFSPLSPVSWTTCALQYLKEVDLISSRRLETLGQHRAPAATPAADDVQAPPAKPRRAPKYPRKPKPEAFGASANEFALPDSGRRNPQLIARLSEPVAFLTAASANTGDAYADLSGTAVPTHNDAFPGLEPFSSLNVSRLKLSGHGSWNPGPFLSDELFMAFNEPRSLLHGGPPPEDFVPVWTRESLRETAALASLWDGLGLLHFEPARLRASESYRLARAFNSYKSPDKDRMIIDRRGQNHAESRLAGPSLFIPVGPMLSVIEADPSCERVLCSVQTAKIFITSSRPAGRKLHSLPWAPPCLFLGSATRLLLLVFRNPLLFEEGSLLVCFRVIGQGDHLGVEFGSAAHGALLESVGFLGDAERLCSNKPFKGDRCAQGLAIDDFFSVCVQRDDDRAEPVCNEHVRRAKAAYQRENLAGSDDKDVWGEPVAKVAGAEINSSREARNLGLITLASPACKRLALAVVSLEAARFSQITDGLMLSLLGRSLWLSVLPRSAAEELVLLSVLCPLAAAELSAPLSPTVHATDASEHKGGYVSAPAGLSLARALWRTASKKGGYSRLWSREEATLARFTDREVFDLRLVKDEGVCHPGRPLAYYFDFIEVGGELTIEWLIHLMRQRKLRSLLILPPVSDFAAGFWPSWRSPGEPKGRPPLSKRTAFSNALALRCLSLAFAALQFQVIFVLVQPTASVMCHLPEWGRLCSLGASQFASCTRLSGPCPHAHLFLAAGIDLSPLGRLCDCAPSFVQPGAASSRSSAFLSPVLASALAHEFSCALRRVSHVDSQTRLLTDGLENLVLNDVVLSLPWHAGDDWHWRSSAHINILEAASILRLLKRLAAFGPSRVVVLVDSSVAFHACAKGRSPSRGLTPVLRKIGAVSLASGLFPSYHFVPTRLNPGDCPTRDLPLPPVAPSSFWPSLSADELGSFACSSGRSRSRAATVLAEGRPVQPATQKRRERLLQAFQDWLQQQGTSFVELLELEPHVTKKLNNWLVLYGRQLFEAGWPYSHFSEVINAVSAREPALRRSLQPAWNLAFTWLREEPHSHHVALPWQVLLAAVTTALMWGWPRVAGVLALTFGALMRIGETLASRRSDLLLPEDVGHTVSYCLVSIQEPKTRFKAARHQSTRLDQPDLLAVVRLAFSGLAFGCKLWPYSASTLRSRFDAIMSRLGTDKWEGQGKSKLDLGSLRAGGENPVLVFTGKFADA